MDCSHSLETVPSRQDECSDSQAVRFVSSLVREEVRLAGLCERKILFQLEIYDHLRRATATNVVLISHLFPRARRPGCKQCSYRLATPTATVQEQEEQRRRRDEHAIGHCHGPKKAERALQHAAIDRSINQQFGHCWLVSTRVCTNNPAFYIVRTTTT